MPSKPELDLREQTEILGKKLHQHSKLILRLQHEMQTFLKASRAVLESRSFPETAQRIFNYAKEMTGATSGYVALLAKDGSENEVLFLDSGGRPCAVDPNLPMPIRGLREIAYRTGQPVFDNNFWKSQWKSFMPAGHVTLDNVMFAPLTIDEKPVGLLGLANKSEPFTDGDARIAAVFGELLAIALRNSRTMDALTLANRTMAEASAQAMTATQAKSDFLAAMSHEVRTPLTAILGFARALETSVRDSKDQEMSRIIRSNGEHLLNILNDVLDISKIEARKLDVVPRQCSPRDIMAQVLSLFREMAASRQVSLELDCDPLVPETIRTDPTRLRQILINLLSNAIKFSPEKESVRIKMSVERNPSESQKLRVDVVDTGIGISKEQTEIIFEAFKQVASSEEDEIRGTGLGLTISRGLARLLGGNVSVSSTPGSGSTFTLLIDTQSPEPIR